MMRTRPVYLAIAALVVASGMLSACSSGADDDSATAGSRMSEPAPTGVTLTLWNTALDSPALKSLYKAYEAASGNTIDLVTFPADAFENTVLTKWTAGSKPDILEWQPGLSRLAGLNPTQKMIDLSDLDFVEKEGELATSSGAVNGKVYGATLGPLTEYGVFYNKKVFADAGLAPPRTFADLSALCTDLQAKAPGVAPIFEAGGDVWPTQILSGMMYQSDANKDGKYIQALLSKEEQLSDPDGVFVKGLEAYDDLNTSGCFNKNATTAKMADSVDAVVKGTAAMVAQSSSIFIDTAKASLAGSGTNPEDVVGFVGVSASGPTLAYAPNVTGTYYLPKSGDSEKERAAIDFVNWITGPGYADYIVDAGALPTMSGHEAPPQEGLSKEVLTAYEAGATPTYVINLPGGASLQEITNRVLNRQLTPEEAGKQMDSAFLTALTQMR
ncbi:raffinose/stachyose/melibiose transport system substrate-binding protein [Rhodococcus sp. 27YEA15]|uniref:ABC transporter substrate-binding protein n=1 Tax=Rhodococcus sp. 27YEA15 TaxID=3156259 RepID=UPI003C7C8AD7